MPTIAKDFHDLMKNIESFSGGEAAVTKWDDENIGTFEVTISPNEGCYKEGEFVFEIVMKSIGHLPRLKCKTAIYHPNINTITNSAGQICLNLFDRNMWTSGSSMQDIVQGLLFLMYNPNLKDPLYHMMSFSKMEEFRRNVEKSIAGGRVCNYQFPVNARYARLHPDRKEVDDKEDMEDRYFGIKEYMHVSDEEDNFDINHFFSESDGSDSSSEKVYSPASTCTRVHDDEGNYSDNSDFSEATDGSDSSNSSSEKVYSPASTRVYDETEDPFDFFNKSHYDGYTFNESDGSDSVHSCSKKVYRPASTRVHDDEKNYYDDETEDILDFLGESHVVDVNRKNFDDNFFNEFDSSDSVISFSFCGPPSTRVPVLQRAQSTPVGVKFEPRPTDPCLQKM